MLDVQRLIQSFEEIVGWPYASPGTNDRNGIDCSGAFVRAYRAQGASIYHGSNTIFRQHCSETGKISSVSDLTVGMAVFKNRQDGGEPSKFQGDGLGNMYHIGLVVSVNPLRIIHATTPVAKVDTALGNWSHYGRLAKVPYESEGQAVNSDILYIAVTVAENGLSVNFRAKADTSSTRLDQIPLGQQVQVLEHTNTTWARVRYNGKTGYIMRQFLQDVESIPDGSAANTDGRASANKDALKAEICELIDKYM